MPTIDAVTKAVRRAALKAYAHKALSELKTQAYFESYVYRASRDLYGEKIDEGAFIDRMVYIVNEQYERAFNAGLRDNGIDPADAKDEWREWLAQQVTAQEDFIVKLTEDILNAREAGNGLDQFKDRARLWGNRYADVQSQTVLLSSKPGDLLEWELGETEEHCVTCSALAGSVATAQEWEESGYHPQGAPNELLDCGGWRCDCRLIPTDKERTGINL